MALAGVVSIIAVSKLHRLIIRWGPVILMMVLIFIGSSEVLSEENTSRIIGPILKWLNPRITEAAIQTIQAVIRKTGHITEYAILAALVLRALRMAVPNAGWRWKLAFLAVGIACLYAASDEFHQSFVPSRFSSIVDVLIDTSGACLGMMASWAWYRWRNKPRTPP